MILNLKNDGFINAKTILNSNLCRFTQEWITKTKLGLNESLYLRHYLEFELKPFFVISSITNAVKFAKRNKFKKHAPFI